MITSISSTSTTHARLDPSACAEKMFARLDSDGDGKINEEEFSNGLKKRLGGSSDASGSSSFEQLFTKLDTDDDGKINVTEFKSGLSEARNALRQGGRGNRPDSSEIFAAADTDKNGTVTAEELQAQFRSMLGSAAGDGRPEPDFTQLVSSLDSDGDGSLSETEFAAMKPPRGGPHEGGTGQFSDDDTSKPLGSIDNDGDGKISLAELQADFASRLAASSPSNSTTTTSPLSEVFSAIDSDSDGAVSQSEFEQMISRLQENLSGHLDRTATYAADGSRQRPDAGNTLAAWA